jgi:hypothetical protein
LPEPIVKEPYHLYKNNLADVAFFRSTPAAGALKPSFATLPATPLIVAGYVCEGANCPQAEVRFAKVVMTPSNGMMISYNAQTVKGMSGGPLFDESKKTVFGVHTRANTTAYGLKVSKEFLKLAGWSGEGS